MKFKLPINGNSCIDTKQKQDTRFWIKFDSLTPSTLQFPLAARIKRTGSELHFEFDLPIANDAAIALQASEKISDITLAAAKEFWKNQPRNPVRNSRLWQQVAMCKFAGFPPTSKLRGRTEKLKSLRTFPRVWNHATWSRSALICNSNAPHAKSIMPSYGFHRNLNWCSAERRNQNESCLLGRVESISIERE